ncbi:hypothetical protein [Thalassobaculum sp.]|uniref:hypothetical protein n=1 Tax=Thalassobaculum sp. TaxID=2022740 RepID=UPI0032EC39CF
MRRAVPKSLGAVLLLLAVLGGVLAVAVALVVSTWSGGAEISGHGYAAMAIGVLFTVALGGGLMALVFYSHRHGYDDSVASEDGFDDRR